MHDFLASYDLTSLQWTLLGLSGLLIGVSKTGISGVGLMVVPILANAFGGRVSVGLLLPILIIADIMAVAWYKRHADWKHILKLIPWALTGIVVATLGLLGGFATMMGNAAGPVMALYLLAMRLPKNSYIGTGAWLLSLPCFLLFSCFEAIVESI